jgi:hypothetical protein
VSNTANVGSAIRSTSDGHVYITGGTISAPNGAFTVRRPGGGGSGRMYINWLNPGVTTTGATFIPEPTDLNSWFEATTGLIEWNPPLQ